MEWIDTHAHLSHIADRETDISPFLNDSRYGIIDIGTRPGDLATRLSVKHLNPNIAFTAGLYPELSAEPQAEIDRCFDRFKETVSAERHKICGIGEFGLDFHYNYGTPEKQEALARRQIELAAELELPVIIHTREADEAVIRLFADYAPVRGVIHCFSSGPDVAEKLLEYGFYLSFCGNLTYKNAVTIRESARMVPTDRVFFETDSPYLAPVPVRGTVNTPANVGHVYRFFAELRGIPLQYLKKKAEENVKNLFGPIFRFDDTEERQ